MPGFNPVNYIAGPAIVTYNSHTWYSEGDIAVRALMETWQPTASMHGPIDTRLKSRAYEVSFTPCGMIDATVITKTFPHAVANVGKSIFADSDLTLVIQTLGGQKWTFARAGISKAPSLKFSAGSVIFSGPITFLCVLKTSTEPTTDGAFLAIAANAFADTNFAHTKVLSGRYTAAWGTTPLDAIDTVDGFQVDVEYGIQNHYVDRYGLIAAYLTGIQARVRFTPAGLTEAQWDAMVIPDGAAAILPGMSVANAGTDLVISAGSGYPKFTLYNAGIVDHGALFGGPGRLGEVAFACQRGWTVGVADAVYLLEIQS